MIRETDLFVPTLSKSYTYKLIRKLNEELKAENQIEWGGN